MPCSCLLPVKSLCLRIGRAALQLQSASALPLIPSLRHSAAAHHSTYSVQSLDFPPHPPPKGTSSGGASHPRHSAVGTKRRKQCALRTPPLIRIRAVWLGEFVLHRFVKSLPKHYSGDQKTGPRRSPASAGSLGRGGATERLRFSPKAETKDAEFATTKARRPLGRSFPHFCRHRKGAPEGVKPYPISHRFSTERI